MQQSQSYIKIKIAGEAGDGIVTAGDILVKTAARLGYHSASVITFPSNIRGGYAQALVTIAGASIVSPVGDGDIVFYLGAEAFLFDADTLVNGVTVLVESDAMGSSAVKVRSERSAHSVIPVPVSQLAYDTSGRDVVRSTIVIGVLCQLLGLDNAVAKKVLNEHFYNKGDTVVKLNLTAFDAGFWWAKHNLHETMHQLVMPVNGGGTDGRVVIDGNQAAALGALYAGCSFYASYPITPATSIGEVLGRKLVEKGGVAYQAEDEIAALGAVIGASFAGVKAMTATSGPGISLMQEFIGYASMVELPVVIIDVQRVGPSTGMPTKHSQDDLWAAVYGGHGEGPRIVVAPHNVIDCYLCTVDAFNVAEQYQCPVLLLSDSSLSSTRAVIEKERFLPLEIVDRVAPDPASAAAGKKFMRYAPCGGSLLGALPKPGMPGFTYCATGIEHNEDSTPAGLSDVRILQVTRRFEKMASVEHHFRNSVVWDVEKSDAVCDVGVCSWGYTASATAEAVALLRREGLSVAALYPRLLYPLCSEALEHWFSLADRLVVVEANYSGQYCSIVKSHHAVRIDSLTISRGEPLLPREIAEGVRRILEKGGGAR